MRVGDTNVPDRSDSREQSQRTRRETIRKIAVGSVVVGGSTAGFALGPSSAAADVLNSVRERDPEGPPGGEEDRTLEWDGQGSEYATLECREGETGYWKWILTPGGPDSPENAVLTVTFEDETTETAEGYRPGGDRGAVHFDVFKTGGGTVESAYVEFDGGGRNPVLTISEAECREEPPEVDLDYWQVDFGEGELPPLPPSYYPDDLMSALGGSGDGVTANPDPRRQRNVGQLGDVSILDRSFSFDDEGDPSEVSVEFAVQEGAPERELHLALFALPGPFDPDEIEDQVLVDVVSDAFDGGDTGELTLQIP